ncbi:hypothetical protein FB45DRAFT_753430, partial [Roridomyces roridus]
DLSILWLKQGWRGSVKAQNFALALNYYYVEKFEELGVPTVESERIIIPATGLESVKDLWTVAYLGVPYLRQIAESADSDGTGYVSVRAANQFASWKPHNWSLVEWLAFCAAGWQASVTWYRTRIYNILRAMLRVLERVRPENLAAANSYLCGPEMRRVELLLRATRPSPKSIPEGKRLRELIDEYRIAETRKFEHRLQILQYNLDYNSLSALAKTRRAEHVSSFLVAAKVTNGNFVASSCTPSFIASFRCDAPGCCLWLERACQ